MEEVSVKGLSVLAFVLGISFFANAVASQWAFDFSKTSGQYVLFAAAGRLLEGTEKELFENANAQAVRIGEAVGFVVVLQALGYTSSMGAER